MGGTQTWEKMWGWCADDSSLGNIGLEETGVLWAGVSVGTGWGGGKLSHPSKTKGKLGTCGPVGEAERAGAIQWSQQGCMAGTWCRGHGGHPVKGHTEATGHSATDRHPLWRVFPESPRFPVHQEKKVWRYPCLCSYRCGPKSAGSKLGGGLGLDQLFPCDHSGSWCLELEAASCPAGERRPWSDHATPPLTSYIPWATSNLSKPQFPLL